MLRRRIWQWLTGASPKRTFTMQFAKLPPEAKFFYFAFQGTSTDDRQWMQNLR